MARCNILIETNIKNLRRLTEREKLNMNWMSVDKSLPPFLRAVLLADGTVTSLISAFMGEEIEVITNQQGYLPMSDNLSYLKLSKGDKAFVREVDLIGKTSNRCYASAVSLLNPILIRDDLFRALTDDCVGMGAVLRNEARGSYREIIDIDDSLIDTARRTYAVYLDSLPSILITEAFNIDNF